MAWSEAATPAAELALRTADKPWVMTNVLLDAASINWRDSARNLANRTAEPTSRLIDGYTDVISRPSDETDGTYFLEMDLGAEVVFNTVAVIRHGLSSGLTFSVEVSDASSFTSPTEIATTTIPSGAGRFVIESLAGTGTYKNITARYVRLKLVRASGTTVPILYEIMLGKRLQLAHNPDVPYDPDAQEISTATAVSISGRRTNYVRHGRKRIMRGDVTVQGDYASGLLQAYKDSDGGAKPVIYNPAPATSSVLFLFGFISQAFSMPYAGPLDRAYSLEFEEQGPHFLSEEE